MSGVSCSADILTVLPFMQHVKFPKPMIRHTLDSVIFLFSECVAAGSVGLPGDCTADHCTGHCLLSVTKQASAP